MGVTMQQPAAPQLAHCTPTPSIAPPQRTAYSDMFLDMIHGSAITVIVGQHPSSRTYTLPVGLLRVHSSWFRNHIDGINSTESRSRADSKKRKFSPVNDSEKAENDDVTVKDEDEEPTKKETTKISVRGEENVIKLPDVDPAIFGLFLKFIYKDSYPSNVDARTIPPNFHLHSRTAGSKATPSSSHTTAASHQPPPNVSTNNSGARPQTGPPPSHMPTLRPHQAPTPLRSPANMPPPPPPHDLSQTQSIPPSIQAWLLAQRLGALSFMNHAIDRIYSGIGINFALTPSLMDHVWKETSLSHSPTSLPTSTSPNTTSTILTPSPLRKLLLDVLVVFWSDPRSPNPNAVILRSLSVSPNFSRPLKDAWDQLFNEHSDLRNEFIHGLQGGVRLMPVGAYFASAAPVGRGAATGGGAGRGVKVVVAKGEGLGGQVGKGLGQDGGVVVKEEKEE